VKLETFFYDAASGWSCGTFPALDSECTLVVVFGAPEFAAAPEPIQEIVRAYPGSHIVGCSTAGEIFGTNISDLSLSVAVVRFARGSVATAFAPVRSAEESYAAGESVASQLAGPSLQGVLVLSDGLKVNGSELVRGLNSALPESVVVTGGLAGDGDRFQSTWLIKDGLPASGGCVSAVGFYGDSIKIHHGSKGGWDIFGSERRVTRSAGNVLYELDGRPALQLYKEYLGDRAAGLPATALLFPLAVRPSSAEEQTVVRTILAVNEETQSMVFAGDVPQGSRAQLMRANFDRLIDGASVAAQMTRNGHNGSGPTLAIAISCVGRRLVLGQRAEEEVEATLNVLSAETQQIGFYSYGELSPLPNGRCDLHNQTMTLTTITED
jgi:hypothetical protein